MQGILQVLPANASDIDAIIVKTTSDYGLIDTLVVEADIRLAPVTNCIAVFLNADAVGSSSPGTHHSFVLYLVCQYSNEFSPK